ncbi:hypothetical protein ABT300_32115 [Streptomyces sp. NPDC001027]|uniref:hypothetical protein n=1 Tax=Streptomyces sp. NPDC001027 TaxID=3154771 RepID=UPI00331EC8CA
MTGVAGDSGPGRESSAAAPLLRYAHLRLITRIAAVAMLAAAASWYAALAGRAAP